MQYSLYEMQTDIEREIRENASTRSEREGAFRPGLGRVGSRIAALAVLALLMLPLSIS